MKKSINVLIYWKESNYDTDKIKPTLYQCKKGDNPFQMQNNLHALGFKCNLYGLDVELDDEKKEGK